MNLHPVGTWQPPSTNHKLHVSNRARYDSRNKDGLGIPLKCATLHLRMARSQVGKSYCKYKTVRHVIMKNQMADMLVHGGGWQMPLDD